jgi:hypothetical protein
VEEIMRTTAFILSFMSTVYLLARPASAKDVSREIQTSRSEFEVTVYVVQSCAGPDEVQRVAQTTVAELFARIDVSIRFVHSKPRKSDANSIVLRLIDHAPYGTKPDVMGAAWINPDPQRQANVYCDRIKAYYKSWNSQDSGRVTGYVIAHELGHVLRAEGGHSADGIMRARWGQRDIVAMLQGVVRFLPADGQQIRGAMAERRESSLPRGVD